MPQAESAVGARRGSCIGPKAETLFTGGITITKESQVLSKLYPQASASAESPGSQRSNGPANHQEEKGERPVYLQRASTKTTSHDSSNIMFYLKTTLSRQGNHILSCKVKLVEMFPN